MCKKKKTSATHSKTTHNNKIAFPQRRPWWEGRKKQNDNNKKKLHLGHNFFVFSLLSTWGKLASVLSVKFVWGTEISKVELLRVGRGGSGMIALEETWKRPCLSAGKGEHLGSTLEKLGGGMGLPIRDPDLYQHLKDKKRPHEIPGFSLS